ncbi:hypothetical protein B7P43_G04219, partial [Cryptotermes secundus]
QNAGHNCNINAGNRSIETTAKFKYLGAVLTISDCIHEESKNRANSRDAWSAFQARDPEVRARFPALPDFFGEVVGLERGLLSLVMIIEEIFQGNSGSGLENRN